MKIVCALLFPISHSQNYKSQNYSSNYFDRFTNFIYSKFNFATM